MCARDTYLLAVIKILDIGAEGRYTKEQLDEEVKNRRIAPEGVHIYGREGGLFETTGSDKKQRLNRYGLGLLLTHRSIKQAKRHALWAIGFATAALIVNIIMMLYTMLWTTN